MGLASCDFTAYLLCNRIVVTNIPDLIMKDRLEQAFLFTKQKNACNNESLVAFLSELDHLFKV